MTRFPKPPAELVALVDPRLEGAACAGKAPLFDERGDDEGHADYLDRVHYARNICARCPVLDACALAVDDLPKGQRRGIWAGADLAASHTPTGRKATAA